MKSPRLSLLLLSGSLLAPNAVRGAALIFDDTNPNETITISANDFEGGLFINGAPFQQGLNHPATGTFPETGPITFSGQWIDNGANTFTTRTIYLVEPSNPSLVSDIFRYTISPQGNGTSVIQGDFTSDVNEGSLGTLPPDVNPNDVFIENGQAVPFAAAFLSGSINSDIEVPEPGTLSLCLIGVLSVGGFKLRQQLRRNRAK